MEHFEPESFQQKHLQFNISEVLDTATDNACRARDCLPPSAVGSDTDPATASRHIDSADSADQVSCWAWEWAKNSTQSLIKCHWYGDDGYKRSEMLGARALVVCNGGAVWHGYYMHVHVGDGEGLVFDGKSFHFTSCNDTCCNDR